jgi:oligoendopeptidase F
MDDFRCSRWEDLQPWFDELMAADLTRDTLSGFLRQQSDLDECVGEFINRLYVATNCDPTDAFKEAAYLGFLKEIDPPLDRAYQALMAKLLDSGLGLPGLERPLKKMRAWRTIFRLENQPLGVELGELENRFNQWSSAWRADFEGAPRTSTEMQKVLEDQDRGRRERAWRATMAAFAQGRDQLDAIYDQMISLRHRQAVNAGFHRYTEFRFQQFGRFDYAPQDCLDLHEALAATAAPLARRVNALRARGLGLSTADLRPWDLEVDGLTTDAPRRRQDAPGLAEGVAHIYASSCPKSLDHFQRLQERGDMDLDDRPGKRLAGFCSTFDRSKSCFIYMTANGTPQDVLTLLHEGGHAMHSLEARRHVDYNIQVIAPFECCEGVAMSQELMALPHLGIFYAPQDAALVGLRTLLQIPAFLGYACAIDAFQHWAYSHPEASHAERAAEGARLCLHLNPGQGWEHFPEEAASFWHRKQHVFNSAFYYFEYVVAQLFALQVWRRCRRDPAQASADLVKAMGLGGTVGISDFFAAAGAEFRLDRVFLAGLMADLEHGINEGLARLGRAPMPPES